MFTPPFRDLCLEGEGCGLAATSFFGMGDGEGFAFHSECGRVCEGEAGKRNLRGFTRNGSYYGEGIANERHLDLLVLCSLSLLHCICEVLRRVLLVLFDDAG